MPLGSSLSTPARRAPAEVKPRSAMSSSELQRLRSRPGMPLSPSETRVLELSALGLKCKEIGERLHLTEGTVKEYRHAITRKSGLGRQMWATLWIRHKVQEFLRRHAAGLSLEAIADLQKIVADTSLVSTVPEGRWLQ